MNEIHQKPYSRHPEYQKTITAARKQYFCHEWRRTYHNVFLDVKMETSQGSTSTYNKSIATLSLPIMEVGSDFYGFDNRITKNSKTTWFNDGGGGQVVHDNTFYWR